MRKQCPQLVFFKLDTIDTKIKSFIHSIPLPPSPPIEQNPLPSSPVRRFRMLTSPFSWGSGNSGWILYNIPFEVDCLVRNLYFFF